MNEFDRKFFINMIERIISAYNCGEIQWPGDHCEFCPYGYGYLDDHGDHSYWWCNDDKIADDAIKLLYILKEKI